MVIVGGGFGGLYAASLADAEGKPVPGLGAAATQEGKATAANILRDLRGRPRVPFTYKDKGSMATTGRSRAVALNGGRRLSGYVAWLMWALVHVLLLTGFRNRMLVMGEWVWAYVTSQRAARLVTGDADAPTWNPRQVEGAAPAEPAASEPERKGRAVVERQ